MMRSIKNVCYANGQLLDIHLPQSDSFPVFIYFHGGGLEAGDKADESVVFEYLTSKGIAVVSANYRMYPNAAYPDFIEDAAEATAWVFRKMGSYGLVEGVYVGGSSAGGYLSMMLCFDERWLAKHGLSPLDIRGYVHDAGQPTCHYNTLRERGIDPSRIIIDESAPLFHVGAAGKYAPMLLIVSYNDMPCRYEQTMLLYAALKNRPAQNVELKLMHGGHCEYVRKVDCDGRSVLGQIVSSFICGLA